VNERLLEELAAASRKEKYGAWFSMGKVLSRQLSILQEMDAERGAGIQDAQNLNGVNPIVALAA
jgi:hypothetical protein